jgi:hypothetical protein
MAERDLSELDLAAAFRSYLEDAPTQVRPGELARHFAAAYPHRRGLIGRWGFGTALRPAWVLLLVGLLLVLVVGGLVAGALRHDRTPTEAVVLPPGPTEYTRMVATSADELWAISGRVVWHLRDGAWTSEEIDASRIVGPNAGPFEDRLTLAPDGTVWAVGAGGVAYRRDGRWIVADTHASTTVAVDREGTVWVAGTESPCDIWSLRPSGSSWTRTSAGCPLRFPGGGVVSMAVDGRGALWVGAAGFVFNGLARYVDGRWESSAARAGLPRDGSVYALGVSATGDIWIEFQVASTGAHARARFDGTTWTVGSGAANMAMAVAVAPDGAKWAAALARYDWKGLEDSTPSVVLPLTPLVVARDGTVFAVDGDGSLVRLPAASPSL